MLQFLYQGQYDKPDSMHSPLVLHVAVYVLADKYFLRPLRQQALQNFGVDAPSSWATDWFAKAVGEVYAHTAKDNDEMRLLVVEVAKTHASKLFAQNDEYVNFKNMARSTPCFAADVAAALAGCKATATANAEASRTFDCGSCGYSIRHKVSPGSESTWHFCPNCGAPN